MKTVRISDLNHAAIKLKLLQLINKQKNPALTMDDAITEILLEAKQSRSEKQMKDEICFVCQGSGKTWDCKVCQGCNGSGYAEDGDAKEWS